MGHAHVPVSHLDAAACASASRHVPDVALVFEGGGMRNSYTAGALNVLLEEGILFDYACGISAGSSHTVNYLHGSTERARRSFVELARDPRMAGLGSFVRGKGYFSAEWIYRQACLPQGPLPFDFERFQAHPARIGIQAFDRDSGQTVVWGRDDIHVLDDLMARVQASSSLPLAMPAVAVDGRRYFDGGLGEGGGIPLQMALDAGYERVFAVLTRPRGYRKTPPSFTTRATAALFGRYPKVKEALLTRHIRYNEALDRLEAMAARGQAYIFYATKMAVENSTTDYAALVASYEDGYAQARAELPAWRAWLGI